MSIWPSCSRQPPLRLLRPMPAVPAVPAVPTLLARIALLGGLAVLAGCESSVEVPADAAVTPPRHLVLLSLDTFRADHLRPELTPRLAALADESVRFYDFVTAAPSTLASHTSLFTGLYPHRHGVASNGWMVPQELETLAELLRRSDFHTVGVAGSFALLDRFRIDQGFDHWDQDFDQTVGVDAVDQSQRRADRVVDAALAYLHGHVGEDEDEVGAGDEVGYKVGYGDGEDRLFLFVHLFDTHFPYDPPVDPIALAGRIEVPSSGWSEEERAAAVRVDGEPVEELARRYAQEAAFVDRQVGRLLDGLARRGLLDDSLVVVTSDHGEGLWQHGERWHATEVYETTTHGVFFAHLPGTPSARVSGAVGTVDVMPTVLAALGVGVPTELDGEALDLQSPSAGGRDEYGAERTRFSQATGSHRHVTPADLEVGAWPNLAFARSVRKGRWKLIHWPLEGREALFDLEADPAERHDLTDAPESAPHPAPHVATHLATLRSALEDWAHSADPLPSHFDREFELDTRRQLCALGYVECPDEGRK